HHVDNDIRRAHPEKTLHGLTVGRGLVTAARDHDLGPPLRTEALHQMGPQKPGPAGYDHTQTAPKAHTSPRRHTVGRPVQSRRFENLLSLANRPAPHQFQVAVYHDFHQVREPDAWGPSKTRPRLRGIRLQAINLQRSQVPPVYFDMLLP